MKSAAKYVAPWLAIAAIGGAIVLAPIASANTDPLVPYGTNPQVHSSLGYHVSNHDEANTTNGQVDLPF
ncbi:hypothetical protein [Mycolicibacterium peregrinum]|uniref:hypothetical protein n=1 Tax=Mycolicibacterium peregrinum TaxID=43304 RepID=UPI0007E94097|nr:hypothetical protein [Mycolicibacterium peregrinum]OBF39266.1 hypothetical protein A5719_17430 [Mycolicibacterium peregrinum]